MGISKNKKTNRNKCKKKIVKIDERNFEFPILIILNKKLETKLKFQFNIDHSSQLLNSEFKKLGNKTPFVWVDKCSNMVQKVNGVCMVYGKKINLPLHVIPIKNTYKLDLKKIKEIVNAKKKTNSKIPRIAHAGGNKYKTCGNSYDSLNATIKDGVKYFELDFLLTKDYQLICSHDWQGFFSSNSISKMKEKPSLKEFKEINKKKSNCNLCTLEGLASWMKKNPQAIIITDIKDVQNNIKALKIIKKTISQSSKNIIPQIYNYKNYDIVKKMGYEKIIWTLYRYDERQDGFLNSVENVAKHLYSKGIFAITMPKRMAYLGLGNTLKKIGVPTYVHTVNNQKEANIFLNKWGITEIYTDKLY